MKKLLALLLALVMTLSLAACGDEPETTTAPNTPASAATEETTVPVTTAPVVLREHKLV